jgi:DNA-binding transcriptional regulator YhcF (GntR family)
MAITDKVKNWILDDIISGHYPKGSKMPSRMELMKKYRIARATADKVIMKLVADGLLKSVQGSGTYVIDPETECPHIYLIINNDIECQEVDRYHEQWLVMLSDLSEGISLTTVGSKEFEKTYSRIINNKSSRVIWSRPSLKYFHFMSHLEELHIPQILINRSLEPYHQISTDTAQGIQEAFKIVLDSHNHKPQSVKMGALWPQINMEEPFLMEREVYFGQNLREFNFSVGYMKRCLSHKSSDILNGIRDILSHSEEMTHLFIPDYKMVSYVIMMASERNIELGKDLVLITIDWKDNEHGIICIQQNWKKMFRESVKWAVSPKSTSFNKLVKPDVMVCPSQY